jgi:biotin-dependent carboxylase-like uncharacterized protein
MSLLITRSGLQTTIQAEPRIGMRHLGVPASGPADPLSMALANHLVCNSVMCPALEVPLSGIELEFESDTSFAISGAQSECALNGRPIEYHRSYRATTGDELFLSAAQTGARVYIAFAGGLIADEILGSGSTYLPAEFGGYKGRALEQGDRLQLSFPGHAKSSRTTPNEFRPPITNRWAVRTCEGAEAGLLDAASRNALFDKKFTVGNRADRMGLQLRGEELRIRSEGRLPSAPVFPGCVQCPEDGTPYLLSVDAQTTGGYPRVAQVARVDRHTLGQFRPGDHVQLLRRTPEQAAEELHEKLNYWRKWLPDIESVI